MEDALRLGDIDLSATEFLTDRGTHFESVKVSEGE